MKDSTEDHLITALSTFLLIAMCVSVYIIVFYANKIEQPTVATGEDVDRLINSAIIQELQRRMRQ